MPKERRSSSPTWGWGAPWLQAAHFDANNHARSLEVNDGSSVPDRFKKEWIGPTDGACPLGHVAPMGGDRTSLPQRPGLYNGSDGRCGHVADPVTHERRASVEGLLQPKILQLKA